MELQHRACQVLRPPLKPPPAMLLLTRLHPLPRYSVELQHKMLPHATAPAANNTTPAVLLLTRLHSVPSALQLVTAALTLRNMGSA